MPEVAAEERIVLPRVALREAHAARIEHWRCRSAKASGQLQDAIAHEREAQELEWQAIAIAQRAPMVVRVRPSTLPPFEAVLEVVELGEPSPAGAERLLEAARAVPTIEQLQVVAADARLEAWERRRRATIRAVLLCAAGLAACALAAWARRWLS